MNREIKKKNGIILTSVVLFALGLVGVNNIYSFNNNTNEEVITKNGVVKEIGTKETWDVSDFAYIHGYNDDYFASAAIANDQLYLWGLGDYMGNKDIGVDYIDFPRKDLIKFEDKTGKDLIAKEVEGSDHFFYAVMNDGFRDYLYMWGPYQYGSASAPDDAEILPKEPFRIDFGSGTEDWEIRKMTAGRDGLFALLIDESNNPHIYAWGTSFVDKSQIDSATNYGNYYYEPIEITYFLNQDNFELKEAQFAERAFGAIVTDKRDGTDHLYTWGSDFQVLAHGDTTYAKYLEPTEVIFPDETKNWDMRGFKLNGLHGGVIFDDGTNDHLYMWGGQSSTISVPTEDPVTVYWQEHDGYDYSVPNEVFVAPSIESINFMDGQGNSGMYERDTAAVVIKESRDSKEDELYMWGNNVYGQIGIGHSGDILYSDDVRKVDFGLETSTVNIEKVELTDKKSAAIVNDGTNDHLYLWGKNVNGVLGLGGSHDPELINAAIIDEPIDILQYAHEMQDFDIAEALNNVTNIRYDWIEVTSTATWHDHPIPSDMKYFNSDTQQVKARIEGTTNDLDIELSGVSSSAASDSEWTKFKIMIYGLEPETTYDVANGNSIRISTNDFATYYTLDSFSTWDLYNEFVLEDEMISVEERGIDSVKVKIDASLASDPYTKPLDSSKLIARLKNGEEYEDLSVTEISDVTKDSNEYIFEISGLEPDTKYNETINPVQLSLGDSNWISLNSFQTLPFDDFILAKDMIQIVETKYDSINISIDSNKRPETMSEFNSETLKARIKGSEDESLIVSELESTTDGVYNFELIGLNPGQVYYGKNEVELSVDDWTTWIALDTFETLDLEDFVLTEEMIRIIDEPGAQLPNSVNIQINSNKIPAYMKSFDPNSLKARIKNDGEELSVTVSQLSADGIYNFEISGLEPEMVYEGENAIEISSDGINWISLESVETSPLEDFILTNDMIEILESDSSDSVQVLIDSSSKPITMAPFDPETLEARIHNGDRRLDKPLGTRLVYEIGESYLFEIFGLDPETTYSVSNNNAIQLSADGTNWVSLDDYETKPSGYVPDDGTLPSWFPWLLLLLLLLILLILLIILIKRSRRIKIKRVIWLNKDEVLILLNKKKKIEKRAHRLEIFESNKDSTIEKITSEVLLTTGDKEKQAKVLLKGLGNKTYSRLQFEILVGKNDEQWFKDWRRIYGKIEPFEKQAKRDSILSKTDSMEDISLQEVYGVGPKIEKHFVDHGYDTAEKVIKLKLGSRESEDLVDELPSLKGVSYEEKEKRIQNIIEELKYLRKEINKK